MASRASEREPREKAKALPDEQKELILSPIELALILKRKERKTRKERARAYFGLTKVRVPFLLPVRLYPLQLWAGFLFHPLI